MKYNTKSTDAELVSGCRQSDRLAQKLLYERFYGRVFGITMRYTNNKDEAVDILNAAFLKVFNSLDKYNDENNLKGWISRIVFNTAIDFVRKNTKYNKAMNFEVEIQGSIQNDSISQLNVEDLYTLIQKLPLSSQTVFCLYVVDGYKHKEIAEMLDITVGTSKWHLSNARKELQTALKQLHQYELKNNY